MRHKLAIGIIIGLMVLVFGSLFLTHVLNKQSELEEMAGLDNRNNDPSVLETSSVANTSRSNSNQTSADLESELNSIDLQSLDSDSQDMESELSGL